jgi:hypothetical protein
LSRYANSTDPTTFRSDQLLKCSENMGKLLIFNLILLNHNLTYKTLYRYTLKYWVYIQNLVSLIKGKNYQFSDYVVNSYAGMWKDCKSRRNCCENSLLTQTTLRRAFSFRPCAHGREYIRRTSNTNLNGLYTELQHAF